MFIRPSSIVFSIIALAGAVVAAPSTLKARGDISSQCDTGNVQCCNQVLDSSTGLATKLASLLNVGQFDLGSVVGFSCSSIAGTGADCAQQPVCCNGNSFSGAVVIGCSPITVNL